MHNTFARCLMEMRGISRMSQDRLAGLTGYDRSYITRLELGQRVPSRDAVLRLAEAMQISEANRNKMLVAAGYAPSDEKDLPERDPVVDALVALLADPMVTNEVRDDVRNMVATLVRQARRVPQVRISGL